MRATTRASTGISALPAHPAQPPGLQHAQQLRLQLQRQLADLVEDQRAARRLLEPPGPAGAGPGEGPALVPEQLALGQLARQRPAVDGDEGPGRAGLPARAAAGPPAPCPFHSRRAPAQARAPARSSARARPADKTGHPARLGPRHTKDDRPKTWPLLGHRYRAVARAPSQPPPRVAPFTPRDGRAPERVRPYFGRRRRSRTRSRPRMRPRPRPRGESQVIAVAPLVSPMFPLAQFPRKAPPNA